jgi:N,N-dimethylformamidase beta subunit-like protein/concanavalin A-like lectin/glucanase superfamily protein
LELLGYAQPCVAHAGETVEVKVSTTQAGFTAEVVRLGLTVRPAVPQVADGHFPGRRQELVPGSYLIASLGEAIDGREHSVQFWFFPTRLAGRQCLMAGFGADGGWEVAVGDDGRLSFARLSATGDVLDSVSSGPPLRERRWYFAVASWDADGAVTLVAAARDPRRPGAEPGKGDRHDLGGPLAAARVICVGAVLIDGRPRRCFNGKIDTPRVFTGTLSPGARQALAADADAARVGGLRHEWRLGPEAARPPHRVHDAGPGRRDGVLVNMPTLGVTGRNWRAATESFAADPGQYQAAHFHSDDLSDAGWATDLSFEVPAAWPSGVYGIRLRAGEHEDTVPLIVTAAGLGRGSGRGAGPGRAAAAVLLPTFSYLAYANEHASWERPIKASVGGAGSLVVTERDRYTAAHRLLSLYELHADGSGTCLSSWRRPVLNMRPGYHLPLVRGPHQFSADLELLDWLESRGADVDVITDDDLHREGAAALDPYRVVLTGSHPEYWSGPMLDGLDGYLADGGRLMYLGGNGFYWVTSAPADDPFVIEVRRGMAGTRVWESPPGEWHQAMTGEHGGIWRHRGRPPQALAGVGFTAQGFDRSLPYRVEAAAAAGRAAFILEGIDLAAPLDGAGSVLGGPAGFEIDRADPALGTPAHAVLVASAREFSDAYQGAVEDVTTADSQQGGTVSELVRSDVVFFETPADGAVFSVGSIAWCGALRDAGEETPVGRMTWNVLSRFLDEKPFAGQEADV